MSTFTMFPSDEQELQVMLHEANELRRARGLQQLEPWWRGQRRDLFGPRRLVAARRLLLGLVHR